MFGPRIVRVTHLRTYSRIAGAGACLVGVAVLIGGAFDVVLLKSIVPAWPAMKVNSAVFFLLAGASLLVLTREAGRTRWLGLALASASLIAALIRLTASDLNVALCFVMLGCCLLLLDVQAGLAQLCATIAIAISMTSGLGYITGQAHLYFGMALHTALLSAALGLGCLLARPSQGVMAVVTSNYRGGMLIRRLLPATIVVFPILAWLRARSETTGLLSSDLGDTLLVTVRVLAFAVLLWFTARSVNRAEGKQIQAEEAHRLSEENYRLLFESNPLPIWLYDVNTLRFLDVNQTAIRQYGYSKQEFLSMTIKDIRPAEEIPSVMESLRQVGTKGEVTSEWKHRKKDGSIITVMITSLGLGRSHRDARLVVAMDVTERKLAERQILERTAQLENANKELEAFSYSVSHDLRAPLRGIDGFSEILLQEYADKLDAEGQDYLRRVRAASQRMAVLIDDLLALSRVTRAEMQREAVNITTIGKAAIMELRKTEPGRSVEFVAAPELIAEGDARLLTIVLENLLGNAWKFTAKHPQGRIELGAIRHNGQPAFFVRDDGAGFDPDHAARLFGAFQRLHGTTEFQGTGIGLATVQRIIHRHGGRVWAEGQVEQGATFYFTVA